MVSAGLQAWAANEAELTAELTNRLGGSFDAALVADRNRALILAVAEPELAALGGDRQVIVEALARDSVEGNDYLDDIYFPDEIPDELPESLLHRLELPGFWASAMTK